MTEKYPRWRKARRSEAGAECVEVALATDQQTIGIRDSKALDAGLILEITRQEWSAFLKCVRSS